MDATLTVLTSLLCDPYMSSWTLSWTLSDWSHSSPITATSLGVTVNSTLTTYNYNTGKKSEWKPLPVSSVLSNLSILLRYLSILRHQHILSGSALNEKIRKNVT